MLPPHLVDKAIKGCHDEVGHLGRDKTLDLLRERFFWPSLYKDVVEHLSNCRSCLKRKGTTPKEELCPISASKPLELVHMDYLSLEPSKGNIENILVITDHFTRYAQAFPSKTQTAQATAKILWENFICHYGFPEKLISDQGRNFESELIKDLCRLAKVNKIRTTPYHPMTNGQCERFNKTLLNMLGTLPDEEKSDWKSHISTMTFAYNCTRNASTNYSPYYLMFGRHPRLAIDVAFGIHRQGNKVSFSKSKYVDRLQKRLNYAHSKAESFAKQEAERNRIRYNKKAKNITLEPDDLVLVRVVAHKGKHKIQNRWEDEEYVVISHPNPDIPVYTVRPVVGGRERSLHRNLLLPLNAKLTEADESDTDDQEFEMVNPLETLGGRKREPPVVRKRELPATGDLVPDNLSYPQITDNSVDILLDPSTILHPQVELVQENSFTMSSGSEPDTQETFLSSQPSTNVSELIENAPDTQSSIDTQGDLTRYIQDDSYKPETSGNYTSSSQEDMETSTQSNLQNSVFSSQSEEQGMSEEVNGKEVNGNDEKSVESIDTSQIKPDTPPQIKPDTPQVIPRRSTRSTRGAPPTRYGNVVTHKLVCPLYHPFCKGRLHSRL